MRQHSCGAAIVAGGLLSTVFGIGIAIGQELPSTPPPTSAPAIRPAVLLLRAWDPPGDAVPDITVVEPPGLRWPLRLQANDESSTAVSFRDGIPELGDDFAFVRRWTADPAQPELQYMLYNIDLNNPEIARRWVELRRSQVSERRRERATVMHDRLLARREQQLVSANRQAVYDGMALLEAGSYRRATIMLTRATELDQGDAASRLQLALARMALGHDREAAHALRRALELQPRLMELHLQLEQYYPSAEEFAGHVAALGERLAKRDKAGENVRGEEYFLLGFMQFQQGRHEAAHAALASAARLMPKDERTAQLLSLTKPAVH